MTGMQNEDFPQAPEFTLEDLKGNKISLSDMSGKVIFLNVWATWCDPCKDEIPYFVEAYKQYKDKGLEIIGISIDRISQSKVLKFTEEYKMNYPVAMATSQITRDYGPFRAVPITIIIDKNKKVRHRKIGWVDKKFIEDWFQKLIEEK
jgi:cytochrome c biogenesis protein CcmG/thiol:disulfide interchange protein DsbE